MKRLTLLIQAAVIGALLGAGSMAASAANAPGECGQYKYWRDGQCHDARAKPSDVPWSKKLVP